MRRRTGNGEWRICVCGRRFYVFPSTIRRGYGKYCSRICKGKSERVEKKRCLVCGKEMRKTQGCKTGKYCSYECFGKSMQTRIEVVCECCGKVFARNPLKVKKHIFCSKECRDNFQRIGREDGICKYCGKTIVRHGRRKYTFCSYACNHASQQRRIGLNGLEKKGRSILENINIPFQEQVLICEKFVVDVLLGSNIVVQWDGDYWHGNPKRYRVLNQIQIDKKKHDKACNVYLEKCGYRVVRFWEWDVKHRPEWIISEIQKVIGG